MSLPDLAPLPEERLSLKETGALKALSNSLRAGKCLIFLGAGAAVDTTRTDLPTGSELSEKLARECQLEWHRYVSLSTTAFYYESFFTRSGLHEFLRREIDRDDIEPSATIQAVVELVDLLEKQGKQMLVVTTNYDRMFERAYERRTGRKPHVITYRGANDPYESADLHVGFAEGEEAQYWYPPGPGTYLYKMHGCITDLAGDKPRLVITEEDYVNFLTNALSDDPKRRLLPWICGRFAMYTNLFIGYGLSDWNFRVIFKATAERSRGSTSYAIQFFRPESEAENERWNAAAEFWGSKKVTVINQDGSRFMRELLRRVRET
jgi:hypothetical protein